MLNCATAIKRKGRLTAMFPIKPDSCTFNLAVTNARTNNTTKRQSCSGGMECRA